ncbi:Eco57I restriction-modification methylase domain-containing protein [Clostridium tagluense]|uniref:Eco57I restriction-modification methylase domain-containing protein n=1 Tax=Clostridium tagluense TaxID=360422 RepID=UPI001CF34514|nr:Eco57I restriction-modification methylase domain-containing protein [Clostridium tagluense]MCB2298882.1 Eco57I restriction-modification methylase domain-containing protein [Clostridium tagluense]
MLQQIYQSTIEFEKRIKKADRKIKGQFFTPLSVAEFMASISSNISEELRILDCGAGSGILTGALLDKLLGNTIVKKVVLDLYENDNVIVSTLRENTELMIEKFRQSNKELIVNIIEDNFILSNRNEWENETFEGLYDIVIANPPYKKLAKGSDESQAMLRVVYGQPNIYFLFMALSTKLLKADGEMIFITPRSFTSGAYFKAFRDYWLNEVRITNIHIFTSRTDVFNKEEVLQEAIITRAIKNPNQIVKIEITASNDVDFEHSERFNIDYNTIVDIDSDNKYILIPSSLDEVRVLKTVHQWNYNLLTLGFKLKTGPVVDFRSRQWIKENPEEGTVPLLYAGHYNNYYINFPLERYKDHQYIVNSPETQYLMLDKKNYLLVKRLTAKEETRRLQCAIYLADSYHQYNKIGIENHINYLAKIDGEITQEELYGMFCLFNSSILDIYYRIMNGNTQVNATEANAIPLPSLDVITILGRELMTKNNMNTEVCDTIINRIIN